MVGVFDEGNGGGFWCGTVVENLLVFVEEV